MNSKKSMTIEDLAKLMQKGFVNSDKRIDDLAAMVQRGFEETHTEIAGVKSDIVGIKDDIADLKTDVARLDGRIDNLELKVDGIRNIIIVEHGQRLEKLEHAVLL